MGNSDILWVTLESVRADHTPMYGYERNTTPFIASLADSSDGTVLDTCISQSMWTPASTASILTGSYLSTHNVGQDGKVKRKLHSELDTLPGVLAEAGYETALFSPSTYISDATGLTSGFTHSELIKLRKENFSTFDETGRLSWKLAFKRFRENPTLDLRMLKRDIENSTNELLSTRVRRWMRNESDTDSPAFSYVHVPSPHHPYVPISAVAKEYYDRKDLPAAYDTIEEIYDGTEAIMDRMANGSELTPQQTEMAKTLYDAEIRYADQTVERIVEAARERSDRDLIVVITADHGDMFGEYGLLGHNLVLRDELINVPMVVSGIDGIVSTETDVSQHIDMTYTLANLTDTLTEQFEGRDLREGDREWAISQRGVAHLDEYRKYNPEFDTSQFFEEPYTCVRTATHKYLGNRHREVLYDLPDETADVSEDNPEIVRELSAVVDQEIQWIPDSQGEAAEYDDRMRAQLQDLGYLT
ncbi:sulfatase [Haloarcula salina]|uniref:sulfatase n=1 Tax=Haloarcula salina TaxID=1429914 RepID=UPI003C6FE890